MDHIVDLIIGLGWIIFVVYWISQATKSKRGTRGAYGYFALYRLVVFVAIIIIASSLNHNHKYSYHSFEVHSTLFRLIGLLIFLIGLNFAVAARIHLRENWGMPMSKISEPKLIKSGPYNYVRHPIYTGILLGMLGTALAVSLYWLLIFIAIGPYFIYSAKQEEKYMQKLFPKDYKDYKNGTKFMLPFIY